MKWHKEWTGWKVALNGGIAGQAIAYPLNEDGSVKHGYPFLYSSVGLPTSALQIERDASERDARRRLETYIDTAEKYIEAFKKECTAPASSNAT